MRHENFEGDYWIRFEMRFFKQKAAELSYFILDNELDEIGAYACELLRGMIDLKKPSKKTLINQDGNLMQLGCYF